MRTTSGTPIAPHAQPGSASNAPHVADARAPIVKDVRHRDAIGASLDGVENVFGLTHSAARDYRNRDGRGHCRHEVGVKTLSRAFAVDRRKKHLARTKTYAALYPFDDVETRALSPIVRVDLPTPGADL